MNIRLLLLLIIIIGAALVIPAPGTASAQGSQRCFASTPPMIFVVINDDTAQRSTWLARTDSYREGEPVGGAIPPGRIGPQRGFGKLWWSEADIRGTLGWPIEPEQSGSSAAVAFNSGGWMFQRDLPDLVVVMQPDGTALGVSSSLLPR